MLSACSTGCSVDFSRKLTGADFMAFRLTYATMFHPPEGMHQRFEQALERVRQQLGRAYPSFIGGKDVAAARSEARHSPIDRELGLGSFPLAQPSEVEAAL